MYNKFNILKRGVFMKRVFAFVICVCLIFGCISCSSPEKTRFEKDAEKYFDGFEDERRDKRSEKTVKYSKNGSYAVDMPLTDSAADKDIKKYCNALTKEFESSRKEGDSLFVGYTLYSANKNVGTVEVVAKTVTADGEDTVSRSFNFDKKSDKPVSDDLKRAVGAHAMRDGVTLDGDAAYVFKNDGLHVGDYKIDYKRVCPTLPDGLRETVDDGSRVIDLSKKLVAITYDDGPCKLTDDILDIYEEHGQVATFFELGQLIGTQPDAIKRMDSLGCEIGSHTWSHKNLTKITAAEIQSQMSRTDAALEKITGNRTTLMRPPYGAVNGTARGNCGKPMIGWSVDTLDWQSRNADKVVQVVKNAGDLDGQVILMHSLYESSVEATRQLVPWLVENGYQLVTVSELFEYKFGEAPQSGKYYTAPYFNK